MRVYVTRKWPLRGRSRFVCWNITRVSLWLLCNVHFVQSTQRTRLQTRPRDLADLKARIIAAVKNIDAPMLTRVCVCGKNLYIVSMCAVSLMVNKPNISSCQKKKKQFSCGCEHFHQGRSFGFLVIYVFNHGEHYETPCITVILQPFGLIVNW